MSSFGAAKGIEVIMDSDAVHDFGVLKTIKGESKINFL